MNDMPPHILCAHRAERTWIVGHVSRVAIFDFGVDAIAIAFAFDSSNSRCSLTPHPMGSFEVCGCFLQLIAPLPPRRVHAAIEHSQPVILPQIYISPLQNTEHLQCPNTPDRTTSVGDGVVVDAIQVHLHLRCTHKRSWRSDLSSFKRAAESSHTPRLVPKRQ
ncbi:hypothetical protein HYFRA_00014180 [Hymenoscyphus fraxineus]|uniref:Uncharacterized protein n=1 Tax=Hymenoscyphus fraxineus TaxID=746836 RepID=A0A9N9Q0G0_9HELO|nr:hypothetical protein HYFRA_00014180 [Hymenoscyphus fraxineus]